MDNSIDQQQSQQWVVAVCQELGLRLERGEDDFFEAGGTSLTAARLIGRAEKEFGEDSLLPDELFSRSTVREIAATLQQSRSRIGTNNT
jgi:acyl carrier protein